MLDMGEDVVAQILFRYKVYEGRTPNYRPDNQQRDELSLRTKTIFHVCVTVMEISCYILITVRLRILPHLTIFGGRSTYDRQI